MAESIQQRALAFKAYLLEDNDGVNLYDHLVRVLMRVMEERPPNSLDMFENMSHEVKLATLPEQSRSRLRDTPGGLPAVSLAELQQLFEEAEESKEAKEAKGDDVDADMDEFTKEEQDDSIGTPLPDLNEIFRCLELAGVSLGQQESQLIYLALRKLVQAEALKHCRLWGKILGTEGNYFVAEVQYNDEIVDGAEAGEGAGDNDKDDLLKEKEEDQENEEEEKPPVTTGEQAVPVEANGTGANKFVYFVCQQPGLPWVKLPPVTPAQISCARQIRKFFTGRLDAPVVTFPPFPGNEANYLRTQIARISAGTQVSPLHYYKIYEDEEDEEEEEEEEQDFFPKLYVENSAFEGIPFHNRFRLSSWVHHMEHILLQGVCTWVNPTRRPIMERKEGSNETGNEEDEEGEDEEEEEDEDEEEFIEMQPEIGPGILTPISEDAEMDGRPAWSVRLSSTRVPEHALTVLRSNRWPGAHSYSRGRTFENFYIGWGLKALDEQYTIPLPPLPQEEYPMGPDVIEALDPHPSMEKAEKPSQSEEGEDEEDEEGNEEEEAEEAEEEDDD